MLDRIQPNRWRSVIVGGTTENQYWQGQAEAIAPGMTIWAGATDDVGSVLRASDWLVMASYEESFSYALAEAWASGIPTLATPVGIAAQYPQMTGILPMDPSGEDIANAIRHAQRHPDRTFARCRSAQNLIREKFGVKAFGLAWDEIIIQTYKAKKRLPLGRKQPECVPCRESQQATKP